MTVSRAEDGRPLQDFLAARLALTKRAAKAIVDLRRVWVNRKVVWMARHALKTGDVVEAPAAEAKAKSIRAGVKKPEKKTHVRILVETPNYIVCDKPAGMLSNSGAKSVEAVLREQTGIDTLVAVHRLDRDTTGCLLCAKTRHAFEAAVEVFKTHRVTKTYFAIAAGKFPYRHHTVDSALEGKRALTTISLQRCTADASLLKVSIETGRTNQIRRHLAQIRFPVIGDRLFGLKNARDARIMSVPRQMLHAGDLELPDPMREDGTIKAHSPLPADFRATLKLFGL
ncbi:MAG: RluA family pseudouridine synthase [Kiritimatiellae bacterium]|nr:RluA family pseudouridine synthase [Kiritimatiellia bacterium]